MTIDNKHKEKVFVPAVEKIYFPACSVARKEFDVRRANLPRVKLLLGTSQNRGLFDERNIACPMERYLFAEGIVRLAVDDLLTGDRRTALTQRALKWADATVEIEGPAK